MHTITPVNYPLLFKNIVDRHISQAVFHCTCKFFLVLFVHILCLDRKSPFYTYENNTLQISEIIG